MCSCEITCSHMYGAHAMGGCNLNDQLHSHCCIHIYIYIRKTLKTKTCNIAFECNIASSFFHARECAYTCSYDNVYVHSCMRGGDGAMIIIMIIIIIKYIFK